MSDSDQIACVETLENYSIIASKEGKIKVLDLKSKALVAFLTYLRMR